MEEHKKLLNKSVFDLFYKLSENKFQKRIDASSDILNFMIKEAANTGDPTDQLQYCTERVVKGLASSRDSARLGYSLLLTGVLKHVDCITIEYILELIEKHLTQGGKLEKNLIFGRLFAYSSIIRSGKLVESSHLSSVALKLLDLCQGRNFLLNASYQIILNLFSQLSSKVFKESLWPDLKEKLSFTWENSSANKLWILFLCIRMFPDVITLKYLQKHYGSSDIFDAGNYEHLRKVMKQTSGCLPMLHPLCLEFVSLSVSRKDFALIWKEVIEESLMDSDKSFIVFEMFKNILQQVQKNEVIEKLVSPKFSVAFTKSLINSKLPTNPAAANLATFLLEFMKKCDSKCQVAILKIFLESLNSVPPSEVFNRVEVTAIVQTLQSDAVMEYCRLLMDIVCYEENSEQLGTDSSSDNCKRLQVVLQIGSLIRHPAVIAETEWRLQIIKFLFLHSFFNIVTPSEEIAHCDKDCEEISSDLRLAFRNTFFKTINSLPQKVHQPGGAVSSHVQIMSSLIEYTDQLLSSGSYVSPQFPLEKVEQPWKKTMSIIHKLNKQNKKDGKLQESSVFQSLFLPLAFHLFHDPDHISKVLEESHICCTKALKARKDESSDVENEDEPSWAAVVVDIMLSLMSRDSHSLRNIVTLSFPLLSPFVTESVLQQILSVINPAEDEGESMLVEDSENESEMEVDSTNDDDEEDDSGKDKEDSIEGKDDSDEDEEDSDEDLEDDSVDGNLTKDDEEFRQKVKEALGTAADDSDAESVVLSDSEMFKLDDAISKAFQDRVQTSNKNLSAVDKTMLNFRVRCLDLISIYLKSEPPMRMVILCIPPLLSAFSYGYKNKLQNLLREKSLNMLLAVSKVKKFQNIDNVESTDLKELLETVISKCHKETNQATAKKLYSLCVFLILCFRRLESQKSAKEVTKTPVYIAAYLTALEAFVKHSKVYPEFFVSLMRACPDLACHFLTPCKEFAFDKGCRDYKRAECLRLLCEALKYSKNQASIDSKQWITLSDSWIPSAIECLKELQNSSAKKTSLLLQTLEVISNTYSIVKEKTKQSLFEKYSDLLPVLLGLGTKDKLMTKIKSVRKNLVAASGHSLTTQADSV